jgi:peptidoglycan/LPS O-acetylase OafA/YrhL
VKKIEQTLAYLIVLLGIRLGLIAAREFAREGGPWTSAFYLTGTCLLFLICGALNLLRIRYGEVARGIKLLSVASSVALAVLALVAGVAGGEAAPSAVVSMLPVVAAGSDCVPRTSGGSCKLWTTHPKMCFRSDFQQYPAGCPLILISRGEAPWSFDASIR